MGEHSRYSASGFEADRLCPGRAVLSAGKPDRPSIHAAWGTVAHGVSDQAFNAQGVEIQTGTQVEQDGFVIAVDDDMLECVNDYLKAAAELCTGADIVTSEERVNYAQWLNVPRDEAWGTLDRSAYWSGTRKLLIGDLKTGKGVEVDARDNDQLMLYAGGKLAELEAVGLDVDTVHMVIFQPRIRSAPSEWTVTRDELVAWLTGEARSAVATRQVAVQTVGAPEWEQTFLRAGEKQCRFCKAKATCPAARNNVIDLVFESHPSSPDEFDDVTVKRDPTGGHADWLGVAMDKVDMIEDWCKAVRAEAERRLLAGSTVPGYKLVQGKRGNRAWADPKAAETLLRDTFRLKIEEAYDLRLISPTSAEKLAKAGTIGPRQWPKAQALITQAEGKPHVAPVSDPRPPLSVTPVADLFEDNDITTRV
jgi:hypothetical protein